MILYLDMDAFFASLEKARRPELADRPVAVGSKPGRGAIVSTCCYLARRFGVRSGLPSHQAIQLCPKLIFIPVDFKYYQRAHQRVVKIVKKYSDKVEVASIDEVCADLTGWDKYFGSNLYIAKRIKQEVYSRLKVTCSIGLAPDKITAKIASGFNKPNGLTLVKPGQVSDFLAPQPISVIPGLGPKAQKTLARHNIFVIEDIIQAGQNFMLKLFGKWGKELYLKAVGKSCSGVTFGYSRPKSVSEEKTFDCDLKTFTDLEKEGLFLLEEVCRRLRKHRLRAKTIFIRLKFNDFTVRTGQAKLAVANSFPLLVNDDFSHLLRRLWPESRPVRLLGVGLKDFTRQYQGGLLEKYQDKNLDNLYQALDKIHNIK